jgi:hypothetical protein
MMDDRSVAQRVLEYIANRTTDVGQSVWRELVANYRSELRLVAEIEEVLRRSSTVSAVAPTTYSPSTSSKAPSSISTRR